MSLDDFLNWEAPFDCGASFSHMARTLWLKKVKWHGGTADAVRN